MSIQLTPSWLGFNRPFTQTVKRILTVTNNNELPVAFKVKTTSPKLYCVTPNSGKLAPRECAKLRVALLAQKKEAPIDKESKDMFMVQSTVITPEKEPLSPRDCKFWTSLKEQDSEVFQETIKVVYLPPRGQTEELEEESVYNQTLDIDAWRLAVWDYTQQPNGHAAESVFLAPNFMPTPYPAAQQPAHMPKQKQSLPWEVELAQAQRHLRALVISVPSPDADSDSMTMCGDQTKLAKLAETMVIRPAYRASRRPLRR